jgi:hypothetical protein
VVFQDSSGQIVPWPHEGVLKREKVADADRPCPACGNLAWDAIEVRTAPTATRYRRRGLVCGACGLQFGGWTEVGRRRPGRDERVVAPEWDLDFDDEDRDAKIVKSAGFAVYGPDPELAVDRTVNEWGGQDATVTSVTISGQLGSKKHESTVTVSSYAPDEHDNPGTMERAVRVLANALSTEIRDNDRTFWKLSREAMRLRLDLHRELAEECAERATRTEVDVPIDGKHLSFSMARDDGGLWCATATIKKVFVTIKARDIEPSMIRLQTVAAPNKYFETKVRPSKRK